MNKAHYTALAVAVLALAAVAGVITLGDDADADTAVTSISYKVGENTFVIPITESEATAGAVTLRTLDQLGATADTGMAFKCWVNGSTKYTAGSTFVVTGLTDPVELVAEFTPVTYTAAFIDHDGRELAKVTGSIRDASGAPIDPVRLSVSAPIDPSREGFIFAGWAIAGADPVPRTSLPDLTADVTYTAIYTIDHLVTFIDGDKTYTSHISDLIVPDLGTRTGFNFLGWFIDGIQIADPSAYTYTKDTTLTAKWEPVNCFVTFQAGSFSKTVAVLYGETVVEPALPEGFIGWDFDFSVPVTSDVTVSAIVAPEEEPTGLDDPLVLTAAIFAGVIAVVLVGALIWALREDKIVIGKGPNAKKKAKGKKDEKKESKDEQKDEKDGSQGGAQ